MNRSTIGLIVVGVVALVLIPKLLQPQVAPGYQNVQWPVGQPVPTGNDTSSIIGAVGNGLSGLIKSING